MRVKFYSRRLTKPMRKVIWEKMLLALDGIWICISILEQERIFVEKRLLYLKA